MHVYLYTPSNLISTSYSNIPNTHNEPGHTVVGVRVMYTNATRVDFHLPLLLLADNASDEGQALRLPAPGLDASRSASQEAGNTCRILRPSCFPFDHILSIRQGKLLLVETLSVIIAPEMACGGWVYLSNTLF